MSIQGLTPEEIEAEVALALPDKEVVSILDLNVDVDVFLDVASPIDLAVAAQLNVAAPIDAAAGANVLTTNSTAGAMVDQTASGQPDPLGRCNGNRYPGQRDRPVRRGRW